MKVRDDIGASELIGLIVSELKSPMSEVDFYDKILTQFIKSTEKMKRRDELRWQLMRLALPSIVGQHRSRLRASLRTIEIPTAKNYQGAAEESKERIRERLSNSLVDVADKLLNEWIVVDKPLRACSRDNLITAADLAENQIAGLSRAAEFYRELAGKIPAGKTVGQMDKAILLHIRDTVFGAKKERAA